MLRAFRLIFEQNNATKRCQNLPNNDFLNPLDNTAMQLNDKQTRILAIVATVAAVGMYVSYIPQIQNNLNGHPGSWLQPLVAACNCTLWVVYGLFKKVRDWPVALANAPGIFLGLITFLTSF